MIEFISNAPSYLVRFLKNMTSSFLRNDAPEMNGDVEFLNDENIEQ